jgi:aspartate racemase
MKTLGILGGMSWESTLPIYRLLNQQVARRLGGLHSAKLLLHSVDFAEIEEMQRIDAWDEAGRVLGAAAAGLRLAGAQGLLIATNTMHKVADQIERLGGLPVLHIADATAAALKAAGVQRAGLLATRYTMEQDFYCARLAGHGIETITPPPDAREAVHRIIFDELCRGQVLPESRALYQRIMLELAEQGAQGMILGCTEISLLIDPLDAAWCPVPLFDTTALHAQAAVDWMLA